MALEEATGSELDVTRPVFEWLVEHCADILTKCTVGVDGKTPYARIKNKAYGGVMYEFGSMIWARLPGRHKGGRALGVGSFAWQEVVQRRAYDQC